MDIQGGFPAFAGQSVYERPAPVYPNEVTPEVAAAASIDLPQPDPGQVETAFRLWDQRKPNPLGLGAVVGLGQDAAAAEIERRRAAGYRFLPPSLEDSRQNLTERILGRAGSALGSAASHMNAGVEYGSGPLAAGVWNQLRDPSNAAGNAWSLASEGPAGLVSNALLRGAKDTAQNYDERRADWQSFKENAPAPVSFGTEMAIDPLNYLGMGIISKAAKTAEGATLGARLLRGVGKADVAADVAQRALIRPLVGAGAGYFANEAAGQPVKPWQAALGGAVSTTVPIGRQGTLAGIMARGTGRAAANVIGGGIRAADAFGASSVGKRLALELGPAGETGGGSLEWVPKFLTSRAGLPVVGAGMGAGASAISGGDQEDILKAAGIGSALLGGARNADLLAKGYGAVRRLGPKEGLFGWDNVAGQQARWLREAPPAISTEDGGLAMLKDLSGLPLEVKRPTRMSNAVWNVFSKARVENSEARMIRTAINENEPAIRELANEASARAALIKKRAGIIEDADGYLLDANGSRLPVFQKDPGGGWTPELGKDGTPRLGATASDVLEKIELYGEYLPPEQLDGMREIAQEVRQIQGWQAKYGTVPLEDPLVQLTPEGQYFPRGKATQAGADETPRLVTGGGKPHAGSAEERGFVSGARAAELGYSYPQLEEVVRQYVAENLRVMNVEHYRTQLGKMPALTDALVDAGVRVNTAGKVLGSDGAPLLVQTADGGLGPVSIPDIRENPALVANLLPKQQVDAIVKSPKWIDGLPLGASDQTKIDQALVALRKETRPLETQARMAKAKVRQYERDVAFGERDITVAQNRIASLQATATDQTVAASERAGAAHEAVQVARAQLDAAAEKTRDLANEYAKKQGVSAKAKMDLRRATVEVDKLNNRLRKMEGTVWDARFRRPQMEEQIANVFQEVGATFHTINAADETLRAAAAKAEAEVLGLGPGLEHVAEKAVAASAAAHATRLEHSAAVRDLVSEGIDLAKQAGREGRAGANVAGKRSAARAGEQGKVLARAQRLTGTAEERMTQWQTKLDGLRAQLVPFERQREIINYQRKVAQTVAAGRSEWTTVAAGPLEHVRVPKVMANTLEKHVKRSGTEGGVVAAAKGLSHAVNQAVRSVGAGLDLAGFGQVNLLGEASGYQFGPFAKLLRENGLTSTAVRGAFRAAKRQEAMTEDMIAIDKLAREMGLPGIYELVQAGLPLGSSGLMPVPSKTGSVVERALSRTKIYAPSERFFSAPANIQGPISIYNFLMRNPEFNWKQPGNLERLVASVGDISGRARKQLGEEILGRGTAQDLWFAGRFVRSTINTVVNAVNSGGFEGDLARESLVRLAGLGAGIAYMIDTAQGREHNFWPNPFEFRLLGRDVNLLGPWDSLMKGVLRTGEGTNFVPFMEDAVRGDLRAPDVNVRNLTYFPRTKLGPVASMATNIADQALNERSLFGADTARGPWQGDWWKNPDNWLGFVPVPFTARSAFQDAFKIDWTDPLAVVSVLFGAGTELVGLKSSMLTPYEKMTAAYDEWRKGLSDEELARLGVTRDEANASDYGKSVSLQSAFKARFPDMVAPSTTAEGKALQKAAASRDVAMRQAGDYFMSSTGRDGDTWTIADYMATKNGIMSDIKATGDLSAMKDRRYADYLQIFKDAQDPEFPNQLDPERLQAGENAFFKKYGQAGIDYIQKAGLIGKDQVETLRRTDMNTLANDGYFDRNTPQTQHYRDLKTISPSDANYGDEERELEKLDDYVAHRLSVARKYGDPDFEATWEQGYEKILGDRGVSPERILDVARVHFARSAKSTIDGGSMPQNEWWADFLNPDYFWYAKDHAAEMSWFTDANTWNDIQMAHGLVPASDFKAPVVNVR